MRLLCITEPGDYPQADGEISRFYRHVAKDGRLEVFHLATGAVKDGLQINAAPLPDTLDHTTFLDLNKHQPVPLLIPDLDFVFCRTRKPFPPGYLEILGEWSKHTAFCNDPLAKREQIEAGFLKKVAGGFTPDLIATSSLEEIAAFLDQHGIIAVKRPNSTGGDGVYRLERTASGFLTDHIHLGQRRHPALGPAIDHIRGACPPETALELVRFLPRAIEGDKRVVVVEGEIYGAFLRRSTDGHWVNNASAGPIDFELCDIGADVKQAVSATFPEYQRRGLRILGYDFLRDDDGTWKISEINAGNIGGFARLHELSGEPVMDRLVDWMRQRARNHALVKSRCI